MINPKYYCNFSNASQFPSDIIISTTLTPIQEIQFGNLIETGAIKRTGKQLFEYDCPTLSRLFSPLEILHYGWRINKIRI